MTTKVIINGMVVEGSFEDIQRILGIKTESARTEVVEVEKTEKVEKPKVKTKKSKKDNKVDEHFDEANLVQVQDEVVDLGCPAVPSNCIATGYKKEFDEKVSIYRISHSICGSAKYKDKATGEEKTRKFNSYPRKLANNEIKKLATLEEFKGKMFSYKKPYTDGSGRTYTCWGFKSEELANKALEILPKFVLKEQPKQA